MFAALLLTTAPLAAGAAVFLGDAGWTNEANDNLNGVVGSWDPGLRTAVLIADVGEAIQVTGNNIVLDGDGFTVSGPGSGTGLFLDHLAGVSVRGLRIRNFETGIATETTTNVVLQGNDIRNCTFGIFHHADTNLTVRDSTIIGCAVGIQGRTGWSLLEGNTIADCSSFGIYSEAGHTIRNNVVSACGNGGYFEYSDPTMTGNVIVNNGGSAILLRRVSHAVVTDNIVSGNAQGIIYSVYCDRTTVNRNVFSGNGLAIHANLSIAGVNSVYDNNFLANAADAEVAAGASSLRMDRPTGGNHWSGWTAPDGDADGFVDSPYVLAVVGATVLQDNLPRTAPVAMASHRPVLGTVGDQTVTENGLLEFTVSGYDPDGDPVTFSAANLPAGASFDSLTGTFTWVPGYDEAGVYRNVVFTVTDDRTPALASSETITVTVANLNRPPVLAVPPAVTGTEFQEVRFTVSATDPDGDAVALGSGPLPEGAIFDSATGLFTWTPNASQVGLTSVTFTATDGETLASAVVPITILDDLEAPYVVATVPANGATGVLRSVQPQITFNEPVVPGSAYGQITFKRGNRDVPFQKSISGRVLTLTPSALLARRSTFTITVPAGAFRDLAGNPSLPHQFSFTTGSN